VSATAARTLGAQLNGNSAGEACMDGACSTGKRVMNMFYHKIIAAEVDEATVRKTAQKAGSRPDKVKGNKMRCTVC
jgi:hypothetical protein